MTDQNYLRPSFSHLSDCDNTYYCDICSKKGVTTKATIRKVMVQEKLFSKDRLPTKKDICKIYYCNGCYNSLTP